MSRALSPTELLRHASQDAPPGAPCNWWGEQDLNLRSASTWFTARPRWPLGYPPEVTGGHDSTAANQSDWTTDWSPGTSRWPSRRRRIRRSHRGVDAGSDGGDRSRRGRSPTEPPTG